MLKKKNNKLHYYKPLNIPEMQKRKHNYKDIQIFVTKQELHN